MGGKNCLVGFTASNERSDDRGAVRENLVPRSTSIVGAPSIEATKKRTGAPRGGPFSSNSPVVSSSLTILLNSGRTQTGQTMTVYRGLPRQEFFDGQRIAAAGFLERQKSPANGGHHFGLATYHPPSRPLRRQVGDGERATVGPNDVFHTRSELIGHRTLTHSMRSHRKRDYGRRLKIWLNVDMDVILFSPTVFETRERTREGAATVRIFFGVGRRKQPFRVAQPPELIVVTS